MKVLHVVSDDDRRGAQVFASDLHDALGRIGHESSIVAIARGRGGGSGVEVLGRSRWDPRSMLALRSRMGQADVSIAHGSSSLLACAVVGSRTRRRFVARQISETSFWVDRPSRVARVRWYYSRSIGVVALARSSAEELHDVVGVPLERIGVIPNGVPIGRFAAAARAPEPLGESVRLGYVGALVPEKGADIAIRSIAELGGTELLMVGDGPERAALEHLGEAVAPGRVEFLGAVDDVAPILGSLDAIVLPSRAGDSMPAVLIEAGLAGVPAVATRVGAIPDVVLDGHTGVLVERGDDRAFIQAVGRVVADHDLRRRLGRAAARHCADSFDIEVVCAQWVEFLASRA